MALLFLDLIHFKVINDSLGHDVGDPLLREVAEQLKRCLHLTDSVGRAGGDEAFTVIAEGLAGVGITLFPSDSTGTDSDSDLHGLVRRTDRAMYRAKAMGRGTSACFSDERSAEVAARLELVQCCALTGTDGAAPSPAWRRCKSARCHGASLWFAPCHRGESAGPSVPLGTQHCTRRPAAPGAGAQRIRAA